MYRTKSETKLVWWPSPQDYNEAVQMPLASLQDPELRTGLPYTNALELPRSITGSFASVYRMHCQKKDFALRLFLSNIRDQHERYALISNFVQNDNLPYTVTFDFLQQGIKIHGEWLPALKMEWLEGDQLDDYIVDNLAKPDKLGKLLDNFVRMMQDMRRAGIAHGDLQHGNILVCKDELRLVDYDGMFVPDMKGFSAGELGHRNYQHPDRAAHHFGPYLDNFSAWIIYASVRALQIDSRLMHQLGGGDDCLLFRQVDFVDPIHSPAFAALEQHSDARLKELGRFVRAQLKKDLSNIPYLELPIKNVEDHELHPVSESVPIVKSGPRIVRGNLPVWLQEENSSVLSNAKIGHLDGADSTRSANNALQSAINAQTNALQNSAQNATTQSWTIPPRTAQQAAWIKPGIRAGAPAQLAGGGKLNRVVMNTLNAAAQLKQKQLAAAQRTASQQPAANLHSPNLHWPTKPVQLPVELKVTPVPRQDLKWNPLCKRMNPNEPLIMMLFNPIVWLMIYWGSHVLGADSQLAAHGLMVPASVYHIEHNFGKDGPKKVFYHYIVNNRTYPGVQEVPAGANQFERGGQYEVAVLPNSPRVIGSLNEPVGAKGRDDAFSFFLSLVFNSLLVGAILKSPLRDKRLAQFGQPIIANIDILRTESGRKGHVHYLADISFEWAGVPIYKTLALSSSEYATLHAHSKEVILYDPKTDTTQIYAFCRYHPTITASAIVNKYYP